MPRHRVLLDECIDWRLGKEIAGYKVASVSKIGWDGLKNGALLEKAQADFDVLITTDRNLMFQQNLPACDIGVIVLYARSNRLQDLIELVPKILAALPGIQPGLVITVQS